MADSNNAILSPVGVVWKYLRQNHPSIELYQTDESHPSVAGTYAAACTFYATIFRKDPTLITFNSTLSASVAANIKAAAKLIVYDSLMNWHIGAYDPLANFSYNIIDGHQVIFTNSSTNATHYSWSFGDGDTATNHHPTHTYTASGSYTVKLIASKCGLADTIYQTITISTLDVNHVAAKERFIIYPNPAKNVISIKSGNDVFITAVRIFDITGREVKAEKSNFKQIDISQLNAGVYWLEIRSTQGTVTEKIVVQ